MSKKVSKVANSTILPIDVQSITKLVIQLLSLQKVANSEETVRLQYSLLKTAWLLDFSTRTIERFIERGELGSVGHGKLLRVPLADILAYQERHRNEAT